MIRRLAVLLSLAIFLLAMQCPKNWMKDASKFKVDVSPKQIVIRNDTIVFEVTIDGAEYKFQPGDSISFDLIVSGNGIDETVGTVNATRDKFVKKQISYVTQAKTRINFLNVQCHAYKSGETKSLSPLLPVAGISDFRP